LQRKSFAVIGKDCSEKPDGVIAERP